MMILQYQKQRTMAKIQKIEFEHFSWTSIESPDEQAMDELVTKYRFHPLDITDCLSPSYRSKIDVYPKYGFIVFLFPIYISDGREIAPAEINVFIGKNYLITVHHGDIKVFTDFFNLFKMSPDLRGKYSDKSPEKLLYEIVHKLLLYCFPMIDHLNEDCNRIEKAIFSGKERAMVQEILVIRRNITDFRKIMQVHKNVIKKAITYFKQSPYFVMKKTDAYFESLVDYSKEIWDTLDNLKERIEALQQTNESQISFKLSDIMRVLTTISVITFPITLIAAIFGMNTIHAMPFVDSTFGFWYVIAIMVSVASAMLITFKKKGLM